MREAEASDRPDYYKLSTQERHEAWKTWFITSDTPPSPHLLTSDLVEALNLNE